MAVKKKLVYTVDQTTPARGRVRAKRLPPEYLLNNGDYDSWYLLYPNTSGATRLAYDEEFTELQYNRLAIFL